MRLFRTVSLLIVSVLGVFFLPLWLQIILIILVVFFIRPASLALIPASLADLAYSPGTEKLFSNLKVTGIAILFLILYWILKKRTRIFHLYEFLEKEKEA